MRIKNTSKSQNKRKSPPIVSKLPKDMGMVFQEGHELFAKLISVIPDAVILIDTSGNIIFINDIGAQVVGYSNAKQLIGKNAFSFIVPQQHERMKRGLVKRLKGKVGPSEFTVISEKGNHIPFEFNGNVLRDSNGSPFASIHVARNISERKKAEEALLKSEQKYRAILDNSPDPVIITDMNGYVIDLNPKTSELSGYSKKELLGLQITKFLPPEELKGVQKAFNSIVNKKRVRRGNICLRTKKGLFVDMDIQAMRVDLEDQSLMVAILRDITAYKEREKKLEEAKKNLEATIVERTMELMEANTTLKVLMSHREHEKAENEEKLLNNLHAQIFPYINDLTKAPLNTKQKATIKMLEKNLQNIMSEFLTHLQANVSKFTPKEIQVASLIREDMSTKDIARLLSISTKTVDIFRYNIRKKLGLNNRKASLRSHLLSL